MNLHQKIIFSATVSSHVARSVAPWRIQHCGHLYWSERNSALNIKQASKTQKIKIFLTYSLYFHRASSTCKYFVVSLMHNYIKRTYNYNYYKIIKCAATCFGSQRIHHQGALYSAWLWNETCWSTFKYFIILIVFIYYILCISWIIQWTKHRPCPNQRERYNHSCNF